MAVGQEVAYGFNAGKTRFVSFDRSNTSGAIDVKMDGFIRQKKKIIFYDGIVFLF